MTSTDRRALRALICAALLAAPALALAQAPTPAPAPPPPVAIPNPIYETLVLQIDVARPAAEAWAKVGNYCDIAKWGGGTCVMTSGKEGELGSVRTLNGTTIEVLVARTDLSYSYAQPVRVGVPYNLYHGTFEAKPLTATTSRLIYSFLYDISMLDAAQRAVTKSSRTERFGARMETMKKMVEAN
jgi:hypothetical protein